MHLSRTLMPLMMLFCLAVAHAQTPVPPPSASRPVPPTRSPDTPGFVAAHELPDASLPGAHLDGDYILGPTHTPAPETQFRPAVPHGTVTEIILTSTDSQFYPGDRARSLAPPASPIRPTPQS